MAGLLRQLRYDSTGEAADTSAAGWGVNATFLAPVITPIRLLGQFAMGEGTGRYIEGVSGQNLDAVLLPTGELKGVRTQSANIG